MVLQGSTQNGGNVATLLPSSSISRLRQVALIISYLSVLIPLVVLICKVILRLSHKFQLIDSNSAKISMTPIPTSLKIAPFISVNPNDPMVLNDGSIMGMIDKVENGFGRRNILSCATFSGFDGTQIKVANCVPGHTIEIADDHQRSILIDGKSTGISQLSFATFIHNNSGKLSSAKDWGQGCNIQIADDPQRTIFINGKPVGNRSTIENSWILFCEFQGRQYLYYKDDSTPVAYDNRVVVIAKQKAKFFNVGPILPTRSVSLPPTDPQVLNDPNIKDIQDYVKNHAGQLTVSTHETFTDTRGRKLKIVNCAPGHTLQITKDNLLIVDGMPLWGGFSISGNGTLLIYEVKGKLYIVNKDDYRPIHPRSMMFEIDADIDDEIVGKSLIVHTIRDFYK